MNNPLIKDQLAWDRFFDESSKRETYPPKKIELFNRLVAYTNNFFLIAAIGAFTPGYLMLITKKLIPAHSMIEEKHVDELKWLIEVISKAISKTYKKETVTFEHGNCACLGGLDRAHLHIMTINEKADNDLIIKCINQTLISRKAGITSVELNGSKLENIHDISEIMNSPELNFYKVNGKQLLYKDICNGFDINNWLISTKKHVQNNGQYVYFKTSSPSTSFLTDKNFQTQIGRQIVFEIEKETNANLNEIFNHFQVCCIPPWKLELLKDYKSDLFINVSSLQEMEKDQSKNYINIFKNCIKKYIYLNNGIKGHAKAPKKGEFGVLNPTSMLDLENELTNMFQIKYSKTDEIHRYIKIFEKKAF